MEASIADLILDLTAKVCVVVVFAYFLTRIKPFTEICDKQFDAKNQIILVLVFGGFAIYGTYSGIKLPSGAIANTRDIGPIAAGLIGGPVIGIGAGLIGGVHRYFLGGLTQIPCSLATVIAGLAAGMIYKRRKGEFIGIWQAALLTILIESLHMGLILLIARPYSEALQVVKLISLPMILANAIGIAILTLIVSKSTGKRQAKK